MGLLNKKKEGFKVGYMYREQPDEERRQPLSKKGRNTEVNKKLEF